MPERKQPPGRSFPQAELPYTDTELEAEDTTPELTGADAGPQEAAIGSAGNGGWKWGGDLAGVEGRRNMSDDEGRTDLSEDEPDAPDIRPDSKQRFEGAPPEEEERELTARPHDEDDETITGIPPPAP
jgi:hypothetical protein